QMYLSPSHVFGIFPAADSVVGTMYYKNQFAALMELAAPIALWEIWEGRIGSGALCFAAIFAATVTSLSRAGVIVLVADLIVFVVIMVASHPLSLKAASAVVAIALLIAAAAISVAGTDRILARFEEQNPWFFRSSLTASTVQMVRERPWTGFGMGTWRTV